MIWPGVYLALLLLLSAAHGQSGPGDAAIPGIEQTSSVSGSILEARTNQPLAAVSIRMVRLQSAGGSSTTDFSTKSDSNGVFEFSDVAAGTYLLTPEPPTGYCSGRGEHSARQVLIGKGNSIRGLLFVMAREKTIRGRVLDEDWKGVAGATVRAFVELSDPARGVKHLIVLSAAMTDHSGSYVLRGLAGNGFTLVAMPPRKAAAVSVRPTPSSNLVDHVGLIATYWPSASTLESAMALKVSGDSADDITIVLRRDRLYSIAGEIKGDWSAVRERATGILMIPTDSRDTDLTPLGQIAVLHPDGSFRFEGLSSGKYILRSISSRLGAPGVSEIVIVGGIAEMQIVFHPRTAVQLTGKIKVEGTGGLDSSWPSLQFIPLAPGQSGVIPVEAYADLDGRFVVKGLEPVRYFLRIAEGTSTYVKDVSLNGRQLNDHIVDLSYGGGELSVVLNTGAGSVNGTVIGAGGESCTASAVLLFVKKIADDQPLVVFVQAGRFSATGLAPGRYYAVATESYDPDLFGNAEFRQQISQSILTVDVAENQATTIELPLLVERDILAAALQADQI
jgi:hypothetical protein